jgi:DNA-binding response OmpR family regulator
VALRSGAQKEERLDPKARRPRILIIDDDAMVAGALASRVAGDLFDVQTVLDGRQGLDILLSDDGLDLAYCDVMMNDFTGVDLYEALQRHSPQRLSKVVFMTGGAFTGRTEVLYELCRDACVQKPFDIVADARRRVG